jgi:hypothetical protein
MTWHSSHAIAGGGVILFLLNQWAESPIIGTLAVVILFFTVIWRVVGWRFLGDDVFIRCVIGSLLAGTVFSGLLILFYFAFPVFSFWSSFSAMMITVIIFGVIPSNPCRLRLPKIHLPNSWLLLGAVIDFVLLVQLILIRTNEALISPWSFLALSSFVLFALATFAYCKGSRIADGWIWYPFAVLHLSVVFGVAVIVYGIGFGFDPFMHRAAETALADLGAITPKSLLYSGQYALVVGLHQLTSWTIHWIDILLVPVMAALTLPAIGYRALKEGWKISEQRSRFLWLGLLTIPFMLLTFTVPFTFTYLLYLLVLVAIPWMMRDRSILLTFLFIAVVSLFSHPLLAAPLVTLLVILLARSFANSKHVKLILYILGVIGISLSVPVLMLVYQWQQGDVRDVLFISDQLHYFFNLFRSPYADPFPFIPPLLDLLYEWRYIFPIILALGLPVWYQLLKSEKREVLSVYTMLLGGLLLCIFLLATQFSYVGVIIHEQAEYALRLLQAWFMIPLVLAVAAFGTFKKPYKSFVLIGLSLLVTHAWFFSYPQYNLKFPYVSPSVGQIDIDTVQVIDTWAGEDDYVVLSHQMMSAAAVQEFGFRDYFPYHGEEHLWYAIPTGGQMYALYTDFLYNGINQETLNDVFEESDLDRLYFVTHDYWGLSEGQISNYSREATDILPFDHHLTIYLYCSPYADCKKTMTKTRTKTEVAIAATLAVAAAAAGFAGISRKQHVDEIPTIAALSSSYVPGYVPGYYDGYKPGYGTPGYNSTYGLFNPYEFGSLPSWIREWNKIKFWEPLRLINPPERPIDTIPPGGAPR